MYRGWKALVEDRFGAQSVQDRRTETIPDQDEPAKRTTRPQTRDKRAALILMTAMEAGEPNWKDRVEEWLAGVKEASCAKGEVV
jgi:hypothetical protein